MHDYKRKFKILKDINDNRYLNYKMTDDKSVEAQSHEIQKITHEIYAEGMQLPEQFQIVVVID